MSPKIKIKKNDLSHYQVTEPQLRILTLITGGFYFVCSFISDGFYQHDEIAHYLNMLTFWGDPKAILGNWAKPGFKIVFVIFALGGPQILLIVNCFTAALTCYVSYKVIQQIGIGSPLIAFFLLALQPMWIQISFRTYSEPLSALLLITALLYHYRGKTNIVSLLLSFGTTVRQEFFILLSLYAVYLFVRREWAAIALLFVFPVLINIVGYFATGDMYYLYTSTIKTGAIYEGSYPKMGFDHYFLMAPTIFGLLSLSTSILYMSLILSKTQKPLYALVIPVIAYFLLHCLFNTQSISVGASTGGNLRYLIVIAPIISVLGSIALANFSEINQRGKFLYYFIPFLAAIGIWATYQHNNVVLLPNVRDFNPLIMGVVAVSGIFLIRDQKKLVTFIVIGGIIFAFLSVKPIKISSEDAQIKLGVEWAKQQNIEREQVLQNHVVFLYFYGKNADLFKHGAKSIDSLTVAEAPIGSYIIWDSHYSYRPEWNSKALKYDYFMSKPKQFAHLKDFVTSDGRFGMIVFQKISL